MRKTRTLAEQAKAIREECARANAEHEPEFWLLITESEARTMLTTLALSERIRREVEQWIKRLG